MDQESRYLKRYVDYLGHIKKFSPHTLKAYRSDISQFLAHFEKGGLPVDKTQVRDFISSVFAKNREKTTIARKIYAVKSFYAYLVDIGALKKNPFDGISSPKISQRIPQILTIGEMNQFLDLLPETTFLDLRNKAVFEFLYATGLRISELTRLKTGDIQFEERLIRVLGKGKKERIVPFNDAAGQTLRKYLRERDRLNPEAREREYVFINSRGGRISERSLERILQRVYLQLTHSGKHVYPHLFRHSFASHLLQEGANLRVIQELLGHANLSTTEKYTTLNYSDLLKTYKKFHPRSGQ